jgi:entry exclusion lipoprotein TrbK
MVSASGCDNKPAIPAMPEIMDINCQIGAIKKIEDRALFSICRANSTSTPALLSRPV